MWVARATGMKVRRYFVGFGPTLWSTKRPNSLGDTEYGLKAVPLGGFCDIAGMTPVEELAPDDEPHAMYRQKAWKRVAVLLRRPRDEFRDRRWCWSTASPWSGACPTCTRPPPRSSAKPPVSHRKSPRASLAMRRPGPARRGRDEARRHGCQGRRHGREDLRRDGRRGPQVVAARPRSWWNARTARTATHRVVDVTPRPSGSPRTAISAARASGRSASCAARRPAEQHNPLSAVPATFAFTGDLAVELGEALAKIPTKIGALVDAIAGGERDPETPISVVGASRHRRRHGRSRTMGRHSGSSSPS